MESAAYIELQVTTNFSFLRGASHADELMGRAATLGYPALGVTDRNSLAGVVRAHTAAKSAGLRVLVGARLDVRDGMSVLAYPTDRAAYGRLSRLITLGRRRAPKGACELYGVDVLEYGAGMIFIALPPLDVRDLRSDQVGALRAAFPGHVYLAGHNLYRGDDCQRLAMLARRSLEMGAPLVAVNDVRMHTRRRKPLLDVLTCIREKCTIDSAGWLLSANAERHLKAAAAMAHLFRGHEDAVARTVDIAGRCRFSLDELRYEYPDEVSPKGRTPQDELTRLTWDGVRVRYPGGPTAAVRAQLEHELSLIGQLAYAPYFLTVYDLVRFARERGILCQGRGSAANSAVCYCLGVTAVDPSRLDLLFERFVSAERDEPPDIDVDFEHERREEVIQYIYEKYGRDRAGLAATVISYRARSAIRDVGKAMGLSQDMVGVLVGQIRGRSGSGLGDGVDEDRIREVGLDPTDRRLRMTVALTEQLIGFPRHLSQHVGGFVMTRGRLDELSPIENAAMVDRTVIEWDKNDLDALGILKVDVLALGMLTCIHKGFDLIRAHYGESFDLASVPAEESVVYDMLCQADSIGVFQVESRAQMAFLPRMKPRDFYDLVIEVAIIRPGPIQGGMVHPYLRCRNGEEKVTYPSAALRQVLEKTLGVPLFQEQAMRIAIVAGGFTPSEADQLRRAMATFRRMGTIHTFREKMIRGMVERGYDEDFAERCFQQIEGFGEYGFPESHAASFALLVYVSAWMKRRYPAVFACALLNSQPMGFYAPAQIVQDARDHGVEVRPPDVNYSGWDCALELPVEPGEEVALRLGLRQIKGFSAADGEWLVAARGNGYADVDAIWRRAGLGGGALECLAHADALASIIGARREALWATKLYATQGRKGQTLQRAAAPLPLFEAAAVAEWGEEAPVTLPSMPLGAEVVADYNALRLSLKAHPLDLLRASLRETTPHDRLITTKDNCRIVIAGLVLARQRPGTAKGVIFMTLEDETGTANVIVWPKIFEQYRRAVLTGRLLKVTGRVQREDIVVHVIADKIEDASELLDGLSGRDGIGGKEKSLTPGLRHPRDQAKVLFPSRDFH